jgi:hypothetical protein
MIFSSAAHLPRISSSSLIKEEAEGLPLPEP